jgi:hypothetical protein
VVKPGDIEAELLRTSVGRAPSCTGAPSWIMHIFAANASASFLPRTDPHPPAEKPRKKSMFGRWGHERTECKPGKAPLAPRTVPEPEPATRPP